MPSFRDNTKQFYQAMGWAPVGYSQEPIHVFNDEYTARPMPLPFDRAWQGFQKRQQERYMDTEWNRWGFRDSYQTTLMDTERYQQDGAQVQIMGAWGIVPATAMMQASSVIPEAQGLLADVVRAFKRAWKGT